MSELLRNNRRCFAQVARPTLAGCRLNLSSEEKAPWPTRLPRSPENAKSDLNRADRDELMLVPGIGPAAAELILEAPGRAGRLQEFG